MVYVVSKWHYPSHKQAEVSGAMNHVLIPISLKNFKSVSFWKKLTKNINSINFPPLLHNEVPMTLPLDIDPDDVANWYILNFKSRFEQAFIDTHKKNVQAFLEEFEFSFLKYYVRQSEENALERWMNLLQAVYNAGERSVEASPDLFIKFVNVVQYQFDLLKKEDLQPNTKIIAGVERVIEDMKDVGTNKLIKQAQVFETYLLNRGIKI